MKVAIIPAWYSMPSNPLAGIFFKEQALALQKAGVETAVLFPDLAWGHYGQLRARSSFAAESGLPTFRLTGFFPPKRTPFLLDAWASKALRLYDDYFNTYGKPDVVHAHSYFAGYLALRIRKKYGVPYVFTEHHSGFMLNQTRPWLNPYFTRIIDAAGAATAVSRGMKTRMESYAERSVQVIPNFIDTDFFKPGSPRGDSSAVLFFSAGSLEKVKGYDTLIEAFAGLPNPYEGRRTRLRIAGKGKEKDRLQGLIKKRGLQDRAEFIGEIGRSEMVWELQQADVFVSSSRTESLPVSQIEAMGCGLPILATATAGARDLVTPASGKLVPVGDVRALTEGLRYMTERHRSFNRLEIRNLCIEKYGAPDVTKRWMELYSSVADNHAD